jgi:tetratricopeptide (TPR) repeat protein
MKDPRALSLRTLAVVLAAGVLLFAVLAVKLPAGQRATVAVSRSGAAVRLLPPGPSFSLRILNQHLAVAREAGLAVLEADLVLPLAGGASLPVRARLHLQGAGVLPVEAAAVRREGLAAALGAWLAPRLQLDETETRALLYASEEWRRVFPRPGPETATNFAQRVQLGGDPRLVRLHLEGRPSLELVRAVARSELAARVPARGRLILLGLDGLDWALVDQLVARGVMPALGGLLRRSLQATVRMRPPLLSPILWTTIATGQPADVHGVLDFVEPDPEGGQPRPVTSYSRKVPALWEMAAAAGRSAAVIGWWATFPAHAPPGCTVYSDRLTEQLMGLEEDRPGLADPPEAAARARSLVVRASHITPDMLAPFAAVTAEELAAVPAGAAAWDSPVGGLARLVAATMTVERLTEAELARGTQVVLSYLEGTDTVGHLFGAYRPPPMPGVDASLARRFGPVVDRYHAYVDRFIARVLAQMRPEDTIVIISDHGFTWGDDRPSVPSGAHTPTAVFWHRPDAVLMVAAPGLSPDPSRAHVEPLAVLPMLLALAGLPAGEGLPGQPPPWAGGAPLAARYDLLVPPQERSAIALSAEERAEEIAKLRALGYLGGGEAQPTGGRGPAPTPEPTADLGRLEGRRQHNLGLTLADQGDLEGAERAFRAAIAAEPSYPPPHIALARLLRRSGRFAESDRELWQGVELGLGDPVGTLQRAAAEYRALGQPARAAQLLAQAAERFPEAAGLWLDLGVLAGEQGDLVLARRCLERATQLAPGDVMGWRNLAAAQAGLGDVAAARRSLTRAVALAPADAELQRQLAALGGPLER